VYNLTFTGTGGSANILKLPSGSINVCNDLNIDGMLTLNNDSDFDFSVTRNMTLGTNATFDAGQASVTFDGTGTQELDGDFSAGNAFYDVVVNNTGDGVSLVNNATVEIENLFTLTNGLVHTDASNTLTLTEQCDISGGSENSYVNGPLSWVLQDGINDTYSFPVGDNSRYGYMEIEDPSDLTGSPSTTTWTVSYFNSTPTDNLNISSTTANGSPSSVLNISDNEYWEVSDNSASGSNEATIRLYWDDISGVEVPGALHVMVYDGGQWVQQDNTAVVTGGAISGTDGVVSGGAVEFSSHFITIGTDDTDPLPVELISFRAVNSGPAITLQWETAQEINS